MKHCGDKKIHMCHHVTIIIGQGLSVIIFSDITCVMQSLVTCWDMPARGRRMPGNGCRGGDDDHDDHDHYHDGDHNHDGEEVMMNMMVVGAETAS